MEWFLFVIVVGSSGAGLGTTSTTIGPYSNEVECETIGSSLKVKGDVSNRLWQTPGYTCIPRPVGEQ